MLQVLTRSLLSDMNSKSCVVKDIVVGDVVDVFVEDPPSAGLLIRLPCFRLLLIRPFRHLSALVVPPLELCDGGGQ